jgi:hypothetical protein
VPEEERADTLFVRERRRSRRAPRRDPRGASAASEAINIAGVVELVDTQDLGSCAFGCEGSSPSFGTLHLQMEISF